MHRLSSCAEPPHARDKEDLERTDDCIPFFIDIVSPWQVRYGHATYYLLLCIISPGLVDEAHSVFGFDGMARRHGIALVGSLS